MGLAGPCRAQNIPSFIVPANHQSGPGEDTYYHTLATHHNWEITILAGYIYISFVIEVVSTIERIRTFERHGSRYVTEPQIGYIP